MSRFGFGVVEWDITGRCNMNCRHCYAAAIYDGKPPPDVDTKTCLQIVDGLYHRHGASVVLFYGGEPLLRDDLEQLAVRITGYGAQCGLVTNGSLLSRERALALRRAGVSQVGVSLDAASGDRYRAMRNSDGFSLATAGVQAAVKAGLDTSIGFVVSRINVGDAVDFLELGRELGAARVIFTQLAHDGRALNSWPDRHDAVLSPDQLVDLAEDLVRQSLAKRFPMERVELDFAPPPLVEYLNSAFCTEIPLPDRRCIPLRNVLFIRADARLFPCKGVVPGMSLKPIGSCTSEGYPLPETPLTTAVGGPDFARLFEMSGESALRPNLPSICRSCSYLFRNCSPCPLSAEADRAHAEYCHDYPMSEVCRVSNQRLASLGVTSQNEQDRDRDM